MYRTKELHITYSLTSGDEQRMCDVATLQLHPDATRPLALVIHLARSE